MKKGLLLVVLAQLLSACAVVGPGERGVSVSLGKVGSSPLEPGPYIWIPMLRHIKTMSVQIQKIDIEASASSKDLQEIKTIAALNWHMNPGDAVKIYTTIGDQDDVIMRVIVPAFNEVVKSATAKKTAEEVISLRAALKKEIDETLLERLKGYGIYVDDVNIVDIQFSREFAHAIEAKQVAEQRSKQAVYEAQRAANDAQAEINRAKGQAEAQRLLRQSIDKDLIALKAVEKWDGKFPQVMSGGGALPFINIGAPAK